MALDILRAHFVVNIVEASNQLTDEEFETVQGLVKKVDVLSEVKEEYIVIPKKQCPKLFESIKKSIDKAKEGQVDYV